MAYYEDLTCCDYFMGNGLIAVGWIEPEHPFEQGPVPESFLLALRSLLAFPWFPYHFAGGHHCGLCDSAYGSANLIVPGKSGFFVCPVLILHYIEEHQYHPPQAFQEAVLACPPTDTDAYFDLLEGSSLIAECEKMCPNLRKYHAEASQRYRDRSAG